MKSRSKINELLSICETIDVTPSELVERYGTAASKAAAPEHEDVPDIMMA